MIFLKLLFFFLKQFLYFYYLFIYLWLCWVFVSVQGLSPVAASRGHSSSRCVGLSPSRPLSLRSTSSRHAGSVVVAHGPSCSAACGIFPDQGSNPCPLHWQVDSQPLRHQGSPKLLFWNVYYFLTVSYFVYMYFIYFFLITKGFSILLIVSKDQIFDLLNSSMAFLFLTSLISVFLFLFENWGTSHILYN